MAEKKSKHIVLAEDEETLSGIIRAKLEHAGHRVTATGDGSVVLGIIKKENPDLVLLDLMLPGMNGLDILEALAKEGLLPKLPVIVISNSGQPVETERIMRLGVRDYLVKVNFSPQEVLAKVEQVFASEGKSGALAASDKKGSRGSVLIVEDEMMLVNMLVRKFSEENFKVFTAPNAAEARRILEGNSINVILLDIVLPDTDGLMFLEELKRDERKNGIPVIIISNLGQQEAVERGRIAGAYDYMVKADVVPGEIVEKVKKLLTK